MYRLFFVNIFFHRKHLHIPYHNKRKMTSCVTFLLNLLEFLIIPAVKALIRDPAIHDILYWKYKQLRSV